MEGDPPDVRGCRWWLHFYPRPPGGGRQDSENERIRYLKFLSTPSGWRATVIGGSTKQGTAFLSTPSGWRATRNHGSQRRRRRDFYPRPPGGGRPADNIAGLERCVISIHALRVEGDDSPLPTKPRSPLTFLSTPSGWRATQHTQKPVLHFIISIHALRVEGDLLGQIRNLYRYDFYPRPPGGGRLFVADGHKRAVRFLSTPSGWRATKDHKVVEAGERNFYPRPPGGGRLTGLITGACDLIISIHALRVEGD